MSAVYSVPNLDNPSAEPFAEKLGGQWDLVVLEEGTCTYRAGERFARAAFEEPPTLLEAPNFEKAVKLAQHGGRLLLLPLPAHPFVGGLDMSDDWYQRPELWFKYTNPPLYLARSSQQIDVHAQGICAVFPNLQKLIPNEEEIVGKIWTNNTQQAAAMCAAGGTEFAVTNQHGLEKYDLVARRELKTIHMSWFVYEWAGK